MANEENHAKVTLAALSVQSDEIQDFFKTELEMLGKHYCMYGDIYVHAKGRERKHLDRFMLMPNGRPAKMGPADLRKSIKGGWFSENWESTRRKYFHWITNISKAISENDVSSAAQFVGVVSHDLGDTVALPHPLGQAELDMNIVNLLFPPKRKYRYMTMHNFLENYPCNVDIRGYSPQFSGHDIEEAAFFFAERITGLVENIFSRIIPALKAAYSGNEASLAKQIGQAFDEGAKVLADVVYTSYCLAHGNIDSGRKKLKLFLDDLTPLKYSSWKPYPYFFRRIHRSPANLDMAQEPFPLCLKIDGKTRKFRHGFGVGMKARWEYRLPKRGYSSLKATVGLNSCLPQEVPVVLEITLDDEKLFREVLNTTGDPFVIDLDIANGTNLAFSLKPKKKSTDLLGRVPCHVVIANPVLSG